MKNKNIAKAIPIEIIKEAVDQNRLKLEADYAEAAKDPDRL